VVIIWNDSKIKTLVGALMRQRNLLDIGEKSLVTYSMKLRVFCPKKYF
jgi:hypothetical protein